MVSRTDRMAGALAACVLLLVVALAGSVLIQPGATHVTLNPVPVRTEASDNFDQLVIVWMENKNQNEVYGPATYMTQLADQYGFAQHWASITNPSQPNYIAAIGASTFGVTGDGNHPNLNHPTIVDLIEKSGHTWKAFAEDASGTGCGLNPPRGEDHFPFLSYTTITGNASRCANLLPGTGSDVISAFKAGTNFIWLTPNDCNNMHSCSVATGDNYIHGWVPDLLSAMAGKKAAIILTFDEAYTNPPYIYQAFAGPAVKLAYKSTVEYTHYSLAKLLEDVWGGGDLGQNDVNSNSPVEFFLPGGPDFSLSAKPTSVTFNAGSSATSVVSLASTGGFNGTVDLTTASAPAGVTTTCVPSSLTGNASSTCTLTAPNPGAYTVTITGTNGSVAHDTLIDATVTTPDFSLSASPNSVSFVVNDSATSTVTLQSLYGFTGTVDLTTSSAPIGVVTACSPSSLVGNASATCTLNSTSIGSYSVTITGTSGSLTHAISIDVSVTPVPVPDFSLLADPTSLSFVAGQSATSTIQLQSTGGFNGPVDLSAESSPSGLSTSCTPSTLQGSDTSTCTIDGSVPGTFAVIVTGMNGSLVHNATIAVTVEPQLQPDFSLYADPDSVSFLAGESTTAIVGIVSSGGFADPVDLTAVSVPGGITATCSPSTIAGSETSTCTLSGTAAGRYTVDVSGTAGQGSPVRIVSIAVEVRAGEPMPDTTPPEIAISFPKNSSFLLTPTVTITVAGSASDDSGIESVELSTDNVTWVPANGTHSWTGNITIQGGVTTIYARATDMAGNRQTVRISVYVDVRGGPVVVDSAIPMLLLPFMLAGAIAAELALWLSLHELAKRRKAGVGKAPSLPTDPHAGAVPPTIGPVLDPIDRLRNQ